jgi:hypothetical protein
MLKTVLERTALRRGYVRSKVEPYKELSGARRKNALLWGKM